MLWHETLLVARGRMNEGWSKGFVENQMCVWQQLNYVGLFVLVIWTVEVNCVINPSPLIQMYFIELMKRGEKWVWTCHFLGQNSSGG